MNDDHPTFLYAMPFTETKIFFEETSLVERPGLEFDDLKVKLQQRLDSLGIKVKSVSEEEYCLIPMGGVLPTLPQRTLGVGGTAGMVHPSTGFMVSKTLLSVRALVDTLADEIEGKETVDADAVAERVWRSVWPDDELRMRTFMCFGMETLMELDIKGTQQFFETFFKMSQDIWGGFLSWRIKPAGLIKLGGVLFLKFSNYMRFNFVWSALPFMASFVKNFATADNTFNSAKWGGMILQKADGPVTVPGQGPSRARTLSGSPPRTPATLPSRPRRWISPRSSAATWTPPAPPPPSARIASGSSSSSARCSRTSPHSRTCSLRSHRARRWTCSLSARVPRGSPSRRRWPSEACPSVSSRPTPPS